MTSTLVFTCCGGAGGWAILRSLEGNPNYRLVGVDSDPLTAGLYQAGLAARHVVPPGDSVDYIEKMLEICDRESANIVWPCSDEEVVALAEARTEFERRGVIVMTAAIETVRQSIHKLHMVRRLERCGVPVPQSCRFDEDFTSIDGPLVVRPITGRGGKNVYFFESAAEAMPFRDSLGDTVVSWFVQERINSRMGDMHLVAALYGRDQQRISLFLSRSIRTMYSWGGPSLGGVPVQNDILRELGLKVLEESGPWYGPVNIEFLYDEGRQTFYFIEINPRYWGYSYLATAAGLNFPELTVRMAEGEEIEPQESYRTDVVTLTSREQLAVPLDQLLGAIPSGAKT